MDQELKRHPLSEAFPDMSPEQFEHFKSDIEKNGQRWPVILLDGMVLDGWHRARACAALGRKLEVEQYMGIDPGSYVLSNNLHRRKQLSPSQRAYAVVACKAWHRKGQCKSEATSDLTTSAEMAKEAATSVRTITDVKKVISTPLAEKVRTGEMSASKAASELRLRRTRECTDATGGVAPALTKRVSSRSTAKEIAALRQRNRELTDLLEAVTVERDRMASELATLRGAPERRIGAEDADENA
ncbi:hypothetical protein [Ramlibacter algicola]|uniref:ParB/Sulfiredoxin domain-containing protein n=1 Tax=Ramlibacter algicola TaxID=2795217 RepID=A0A934Q0L2_9BURK|nr:hypothetical protein [Ramlibacter algicola]MBK0392099.1 hypothetical protein [Ramlibacter algicola]